MEIGLEALADKYGLEKIMDDPSPAWPRKKRRRRSFQLSVIRSELAGLNQFKFF
jgi:hypothetical protein